LSAVILGRISSGDPTGGGLFGVRDIIEASFSVAIGVIGTSFSFRGFVFRGFGSSFSSRSIKRQIVV
jgi:hypothetical protein